MSEVFDEKLKETMGIALGEASMCWSEVPKGVFESTRCKGIVDRVIKAIEEHDKAVIEGKDKEIERIKAIATEIISKDPAYHCYRDLQKAAGILSVLLGEEDAEG